MPDQADFYAEVNVTVYKSVDTNGKEVFGLDVNPLAILTSPEVEDEEGKTVGVKWNLSVKPPDDFPYIAKLTVSFKQSQTPFSQVSYPPETLTAHATAPDLSNTSGQDVLSGAVLNTAVGGGANDTKLYAYAVQVSVWPPDDPGKIQTASLDPSVIVRRKKLSRDKTKWQEW